MEFRLLGPIEAWDRGEQLAVGGGKQRALLALLLINAGRAVPVDQVVDELWCGRPPPTAKNALWVYIANLRGALEPGRARGDRSELLVTGPSSYALHIDGEAIDSTRFERLSSAGQEALRSDPAAALAVLRDALQLWRGPALAELGTCEFAQSERMRLEELKAATIEARLEAELMLGRHAEVVGELKALVGRHPLRERLHGLLMTALYRSDRQAEALAAYESARTVLVSELGIDPGVPLQRLHQAILRHEPGFDSWSNATNPDQLAAGLGIEPGEELRRLEQAVLRQEVPAASAARHNLPAPLTSFLDREQASAGLEQLLGTARLITLTGTGGVGKTRLAMEAAARAVQRFADGVWLADLVGISDPGLLGAKVMQALGVRQAGDVPVMEALRFRLRSADMLLVLDNCEHLLDACAELAHELLRSSPGLRVLATSREPLGLPGESAYTVGPLDLPSDAADTQAAASSPAVRLFLERGSAARGATSRRVVPVAVAERICRKLDGLPLAIELAAARLGTLSAGEIETHLTDRFRFLAYRRPTADRRHQALRTAMDWSYELLSADERRVLGELSVFAGTFGLEQAAEVCSAGDDFAALEVIDRLASKSLLAVEPAEDGTRYRLLETVRQYAAGRLAEAGGAETTRRRHASAFLHLAERERELPVLARDHDNFRAALEWSLPHGDQTGPRLARALGYFWLGCGLLQEGCGWLERALAHHPENQNLRADLLRVLGKALYEAGELDQAKAVGAEGSVVAAAAGLPALQARICIQLTEIRALEGGTDATALAECEAATAVLDAEGDLEGLTDAWLLTGKLRFWLGESPADQEALERAMAYAQETGNHHVRAQASRWLVSTFMLLTIPADAAIARAVQLLQAANGDPWAEAEILAPLALIYAYAGRSTEARQAITRAQSVHGHSGAKLTWALDAGLVGMMELVSGNPAAAEHHLKEGYEALRAMGERGYLSTNAGWLAEALYAQGRNDEAQQMAEEAQAAAPPADIDAQARWRATQAKLLAQHGQFPAARRLADEAHTLVSPTSWAALQAEVLMAKAEVDRLVGARDHAEASLRAALRIYQDRHAIPLAEQAKVALAILGA